MLAVYEGLVSYKPGTWEVVNTLAESITPSADGLTIDFKLKKGFSSTAATAKSPPTM